jgi:hypothetical protein
MLDSEQRGVQRDLVEVPREAVAEHVLERVGHPREVRGRAARLLTPWHAEGVQRVDGIGGVFFKAPTPAACRGGTPSTSASERRR